MPQALVDGILDGSIRVVPSSMRSGPGGWMAWEFETGFVKTGSAKAAFEESLKELSEEKKN